MLLDKSAASVETMFGEIAGRYDFLNRLLSLGIDRSWRRRTGRLVAPEGSAPILDVCTGTADLALEYWRASGGAAAGVGTDFCPPMLEIARKKCRRAGALGDSQRGQSHFRCAKIGTVPGCAKIGTAPGCENPGTLPSAPGIALIEADTLHLPFPDDTFQIVSVAFGLRNVADPDAGLREMTRVCRPGGRVAVLEFSPPTAPLIGTLFDWYFRKVLPRIGQSIARNSEAAYSYLPASVGRFPQGEALAERLRTAGLTDVWLRPFTFRVATLYVGRKG